MVIIYEILVFIDKNFHTYLVRDPYAFGNVLNYWWIIWSFHNNQSCPVLGWSTLLASMAVTALYRQVIQRYCFGDKYLNLNTINIWFDIHSKDQFKVKVQGSREKCFPREFRGYIQQTSWFQNWNFRRLTQQRSTSSWRVALANASLLSWFESYFLASIFHCCHDHLWWWHHHHHHPPPPYHHHTI